MSQKRKRTCRTCTHWQYLLTKGGDVRIGRCRDHSSTIGDENCYHITYHRKFIWVEDVLVENDRYVNVDFHTTEDFGCPDWRGLND